MNDPDDELVAALRLVGELLKKSAAEDLKALLAGDSKLVIVPKSWRPAPPKTPGTAVRQRPAAKVELPPLSTIRAQLVNAVDAEARVALLAALQMGPTQARKLAKDLGVTGAGRSTPDEAIDKIVTYFAGSSPFADRV